MGGIPYGIGSDKNGKPVDGYIDVDKQLATIQRGAAKRFGGSTLIFGEGSWLDGSHNLVAEECVVLRIDGVEDVESVRQFAGLIRDTFNQSSILFSATPLAVEFI